jgi:putative pyruvate formate lyase activating enzyme
MSQARHGERPAAGYTELYLTGELARRAETLATLLERCRLCPCGCGADRRSGLGRCATPAMPVVASYGPHFGEEPPISGRRGSGTIFLANCNLRCMFCQNADISQRPKEFIGGETSVGWLAGAMLDLQERGCHNINWVSPTHQVPQLVAALRDAAARGLTIPIVYNTNAYDSTEVLSLLDGVVDIYMPDLKYADEETASRLSRVPDYPRIARAAVAEMYRQVGADWRVAEDGTLTRGLLVRLLVLPRRLAGVDDSLRWLAEGLSPAVTVSLLSQYRPHHFAARAGRLPDVARPITPSEYAEALAALARWNRSPHTLIQPYLGRDLAAQP